MDSLFSLKGKTVLIVGASSGIGAHAAKLFASQGAELVLAARRKELLDATSAKTLYLDVTKPETFTEALTHIPRIDVLLITAGTNIRKPPLEHTEEDWDKVMDLNLKGSWSMAQAVIKHMVERKVKGKIIFVSSIYGHVTSLEHTLYAVSKAGIEQLTRSFALGNGSHGICINAIAPTYIETDLNRDYLRKMAPKIIERTPLGRLGNLSDLDGALLLLASSASDFITGSIIPVDGGCACQQFI